MRSLSVLFTNNTLADRAGSELWVRDVCRALIGRGHRPTAFSLVLGAVAEDLRSATVPVVSDLDNVAVTPDLIHGHHHIETLIAALHFPGVPIVHFCHGFLPWEEEPLRHPSIVRYVAVDEPTADRLTLERGIGPERLERLLNFVDLQRFAPRGPLPARPKRALVFSNQATHSGYAAVIRDVCQRQDIELEIVGHRSGRIVDRPEELLASVDLVFAKGRAALEALAVGCAVVVADEAGCGPIVTELMFDAMRSCNFGVRLLRQRHSVEWYQQQIASYDASDAARVSARVRESASLDRAVDRLLEIYERALSDGATAGDALKLDDAAKLSGGTGVAQRGADVARQRAAAKHLASVAARMKRTAQLEATVSALSNELSLARVKHEQIAAELGEMRRLNEELMKERTRSSSA